MPYGDLVSEGRIRPHGMTPEECRQHLAELLTLAELDLFDASIAQRPLDRRQNSAYEAARAVADTVLAAEGYRRAGGDGQHAVLFAFLRLVDGGRFAEAARYFDIARKLRNKSRYEKTGVISEATAIGTIKRAQQFLVEVRAWLAEKHPDLVAKEATEGEVDTP
jgi:hypothetical protein